MLLQNRYGDKTFPVQDRWSNVKTVRGQARQRDPRGVARRNRLVLLPAVLVLVLAWVLAPPLAPIMPPGLRTPDLVIAFGTLLFFGLLLVSPLLTGLIDRSLPRREQQRYWTLTAAIPVSEEQQQILALDSQSDYSIGGWNSSLDYAPAWSRMPAELRRTAEHDAKLSFFVTMPLFAVAAMRVDLDQRHHIASGADVELFAADALSEAGLSARFHAALHGADGERMLARIASLTGWSQWDLRALDEESTKGPAHLLWGADAQRVISIVRTAYLAEHVTADATWQMLERAAQPAWALFDSWEAYWANVRVGVAFSTDSLQAVQQFDDALAGLRRSEWPATRTVFRSAPVPPWLPRFSRADQPRDADGA